MPANVRAASIGAHGYSPIPVVSYNQLDLLQSRTGQAARSSKIEHKNNTEER